ncbi:MAG: redoxin domain-containing protein [Breznakibacter sp.]
MGKVKLLLGLALAAVAGAPSVPQTPDERGYLVNVGDTAPDFVTTLDNGKTFKLSDYRGQTVMLQFTASWCSVCRKEMPHIEQQIWQAYKDKGLVVVGIDRDEPLETLKTFAQQTGITYPLALDPNADIFGLYADKKAGVTRNVLIDKDGKIVFLTRLFNPGEFDALVAKIGELMK